MIWQSLRGHHRQVEMFRRAIARGRLSHAYLFHGPQGVGKKRCAELLAQCLFCERYSDGQLDACGECANCRRMQAGTHPDLHTVACPAGKAVLPLELIAGPKERRGREGLCYELSLRPSTGDRKIAIIDDAGLFNAESANALLKTLEEPPDYCTLILIADAPDVLLPTIRSRCQWVPFASLSDADISDLLVELNLVETDNEARDIARLCVGSLETARHLLNPELRELRNAVFAALEAGDFHTVKVADELMSAVQSFGEMPAQRKAATWIVRFCMDVYSRRLHPVNATAGELEIAGKQIDRCAEAVRQIESNAQVSLVVHALLNDLNCLTRQAGVG